MRLKIPSKVYSIFNDFVANHCERLCTLFFPSTLIECVNCYSNTLHNVVESISIYRPGGPMPFASGMTCPYCAGRGSIEQEVKKQIPARIYWKRSDFLPIPDSINIPRNAVQTYVNMTYLPDIERASYMMPQYDGIDNFKLNKYFKKSPSYPEGLKDNPVKYVINIWATDDN